MASKVNEVIAGMENEEVESDSNDCFGLFTSGGQPIAVGHSMLDKDWPQYQVLQGSRLTDSKETGFEEEVGSIQRIRIVA